MIGGCASRQEPGEVSPVSLYAGARFELSGFARLGRCIAVTTWSATRNGPIVVRKVGEFIIRMECQPCVGRMSAKRREVVGIKAAESRRIAAMKPVL